MEIDDLAHHAGEWLSGSGAESEIVISSRIRLARNLADYPFVPQTSEEERAEISDLLKRRIERSDFAEGTRYVDLLETSALDDTFLVERHLISRELAQSEGPRGVAFGKAEIVSVMVNEEDHLRIQVLRSGLALEEAWDDAQEVDQRLEGDIAYAFSPQFGYLTACPTNVGTGIRVSVMLHLPALVMTRQIEKVFRSLHKISLAVRGLYGEGSQAMGDFYQISNQVTLGRAEEDIIKQVGDVVPVIIEYERQARDFLIRESQENLHDRVARAYGILRNAQTISSEETMHLLSSVRMGINLGMIDDLKISTVNELFIHTQPAHLQKLSGVELDTTDRNIERARYLRSHLGPDGPEESEKN